MEGTQRVKVPSGQGGASQPEASLLAEYGQQARLETRRRQFDEWLYERSHRPTREDERFRSWTEVPLPQANAAVIYIMDVSGSMTDDQKEIVRTEAFWIDTWLQSQYKGVVTRYIIHDAQAREVDRETFFHTRESGGTMISSAYRL